MATLDELFGLTGKVALVTGGASGIGEGICELLAGAGASVVIADINLAAAQAKAGSLNDAGGSALAVELNLADETSIVACCERVLAEVGCPWILVNNAGVQDREAFLEGSAAEWDRLNAINARGPYLLMREVARAMVAKGEGGRIVNIASVALVGGLIKGLVAYAGSKGALHGVSGAGAFELAEYGITVNTVLPGGVPTPGAISAKGPAAEGPARRQVPLGMCEPGDIAGAVLYLASPAARKVTNQTLTVDGGFSVT